MEKVLEIIKQKRLLKGLSQAVMGRKLNIVSSAYGKIERGQTELSIHRIAQICEVLDLNIMELARALKKARENSQNISPSTGTKKDMVHEFDISNKISYILKSFVNSLVYEKYRQIMLDYPFEEFTAKDLWHSIDGNKEEGLGMTEAEFWDNFGGGYQEVFLEEDEYDGFRKLMKDSNIFYFFKFGLIEDEKLKSLFSKYLSGEDTKCYPLNLKRPLTADVVSEYLSSLTKANIYCPQEGPFAESTSNSF